MGRSVNLDDLIEEPGELTLAGRTFRVPELKTVESAELFRALEEIGSGDVARFRQGLEDAATEIGNILARALPEDADPPTLELTQTQVIGAITFLLGGDPADVLSGGAQNEDAAPLAPVSQPPSAKRSPSGSLFSPASTGGETGGKSRGRSSVAASDSPPSKPAAAATR